MGRKSISADMPIAEAGRCLMARELDIVMDCLPKLRSSAKVTAVHDARKAIRRSFTLFKLFTPYFKPEALVEHRRGLRRIMRYLAPCRDVAVFREKLAQYNETAGQPLACLTGYWEKRQRENDLALQDYVRAKKTQKFLKSYRDFTEKPGAGVPAVDKDDPQWPARYAIPVLIYQKLGALRAYSDMLAQASPEQLHMVRIRFKELRYTLQFFEPVLGPSIDPVADVTRRVQDHLGHLNDTTVALALLEGMKNACPEDAAVYRAYQETEHDRLAAEFPPLWAEFNAPEMRQCLGAAVAAL